MSFLSLRSSDGSLPTPDTDSGLIVTQRGLSIPGTPLFKRAGLWLGFFSTMALASCGGNASAPAPVKPEPAPPKKPGPGKIADEDGRYGKRCTGPITLAGASLKFCAWAKKFPSRQGILLGASINTADGRGNYREKFNEIVWGATIRPPRGLELRALKPIDTPGEGATRAFVKCPKVSKPFVVKVDPYKVSVDDLDRGLRLTTQGELTSYPMETGTFCGKKPDSLVPASPAGSGSASSSSTSALPARFSLAAGSSPASASNLGRIASLGYPKSVSLEIGL